MKNAAKFAQNGPLFTSDFKKAEKLKLIFNRENSAFATTRETKLQKLRFLAGNLYKNANKRKFYKSRILKIFVDYLRERIYYIAIEMGFLTEVFCGKR